MSAFPNRGIFHTGIVFCRYTNKYESVLCAVINSAVFRFVYVRYATGLVNEGTKLLHLATSLFITTFTINLLFMWTVRIQYLILTHLIIIFPI